MINENDPITLAEACEIVFRNTIKPATLLAEHGRGRLVISKIGRAYFTTLRDARELLEKCRVEREARGSISTKNAGNGLSETDSVSCARAGANQAVSMLKSLSKNTLGKSTSRNRQPTR